MKRGVLVATGLLLLLGGGGAWWWATRPPTTVERVREVEEAWFTLRDAVLNGDDETFFRMHSREARERAIAEFPNIRALYLESGPEHRAAFREIYGIEEELIVSGDPEKVVQHMVPVGSGWRERAGVYEKARVRDIRINELPARDGRRRFEAIVLLDISAALADPDQPIAENFLPTIVFVLDEDGWRRRDFFPGAPESDRK